MIRRSGATYPPYRGKRAFDLAVLAVLAVPAAAIGCVCAVAVRLTSRGPVFFLQEQNGTWDVSTSDEVCGTASAGLPPKLLAYCASSSPTAS